MNSPAASPNPNHRIGADVYVRAPDDATIQFKARNFKVDFAKQEADIGMYPRRWGNFSELHLPDAYRVTIPLAELSLTPFAGAEQMGFEEYLLSLKETPPPWMDNAGIMHAVSCEEPVAAAHPAELDADGVPTLPLEPPTEREVAAAKPVVPEAVRTATEVEKPAKPKASKAKPADALFTKEEVVKKYNELKGVVEQLGKMIEAL